jgi:UDP-glucose 4-epimerase
MNPTALITGATGSIGPWLVRRLLEADWKIRILARQHVPPELSGSDVDCIRGDITDSTALRQATAGADVVFHLAAKLHINNPSPELESEYRRVNVEGTAKLAEAARDAGARRLVFFSTIHIYGNSQPGEMLDENSPLQSTSYYAATKIDAERVALATLPTVVLRLAAVYGPGMKGNYPRLLRALRRGRFAFIGDGRNRRTLVHVEDVCHAAILAANHEAAADHIYNVTDGDVHTLREIVEAMCLAMNRNPPRLHLPVGPVRLAAGLVENALRIALRRRVPVRAAVDKIVEDIAVRGDRIATELGFRPQHDLARGWRETIVRLNASGEGAVAPSPSDRHGAHTLPEWHRKLTNPARIG